MRHLLLAALLPLACGQPAAAESTSTPDPVTLRWMNVDPACWEPLDVTRLPWGGPAMDVASQAQQHNEMLASFAGAYARAVLHPVRNDPTAMEWNATQQNARIEGRTLARGTDWGILGMEAALSDNGVEAHLAVDVRYDPERTHVEINGDTLEYTEFYQRFNQSIRGCDPTTGISFEVRTWAIHNTVMDNVLVCWRNPSIVSPVIERSLGECDAALYRTGLARDIFPHLPPTVFAY